MIRGIRFLSGSVKFESFSFQPLAEGHTIIEGDSRQLNILNRLLKHELGADFV